MGNGSVVQGGGVQYMTAGTGVQHSEFNPSRDEPVRLLQIWLMPTVRGAKPRYETLDLSPEEKDGKLKLFISEDGRDGSIKTLAPGEVYAATLNGEQTIPFDVRAGRSVFIQVARGSLSVNGEKVEEGDAAMLSEAGPLTLDRGEKAEILLFDLRKVS
jgi:redox-sensitive bicupin YhaK (pirin superfamily)